MGNQKSQSKNVKLANTLDYLEKVRIRAYEIWEDRCRNRLPGDASTDWLSAETDVNGSMSQSKKIYKRRKK